jgi:hypothetical protein
VFLAFYFFVLSTSGILLLYASHSWHSISLHLVLAVLLAFCFLMLSVLDTLFFYMFSVLGIFVLSAWHSWHFASLYLTFCFFKAWLCLEQQVAF